MVYWTAHASIVTGSAHLADGMPCQDAVRAHQSNGLSVIVSADGLSSCDNAHFGAEITTKVTMRYLIGAFDGIVRTNRQFRHELIGMIRSAHQAYAARQGIDILSLQSTLTFVAHDSHHHILGRIGDGVIGMYDANGVHVASMERKTEQIEMTDTVLSGNIDDVMDIRMGPMEGISGFVVMTDGTAHALVRRSDNTFSDAMVSLFKRLETMRREDYHAALDDAMKRLICKKTSDDCSIALTGIVQAPKPRELDCAARLYIRFFPQDTNRGTVIRKDMKRFMDALVFPASTDHIKRVSGISPDRIYRMILFFERIKWLVRDQGLHRLVMTERRD
jgi:hypothetical protein